MARSSPRISKLRARLQAIRRMSGSGFDPLRNCLNLTSYRFNPRAMTLYLKSHPTLAHLFETLVSRPFRNEIEALGGYDTSETGKLHALRVG